ncbi:MAG: hypothetical protein K0V04_36390 [Deltaproteobacteria bacterium]|nr:hypothetical protein [Deltaproteobacteria bacterium]
MTDPKDIDRAIEQMAVFDRCEREQDSCPDPWWAVSRGDLPSEQARATEHDALTPEQFEALMTPLDQTQTDSIVEAVMRSSAPRPVRGRWRWPTVIVLGLSVAAGLVLWVWLGGSTAPAAAELMPHRLELGGTARMLGAAASTPRAYGPGDEFLLRAVPESSGKGAPPAQLYAIPRGGGPRRTIDLPQAHGKDDVIEFRGDISERLPPGGWVLRLELGGPERCRAQGDEGCVEAEVDIEVVAH